MDRDFDRIDTPAIPDRSENSRPFSGERLHHGHDQAPARDDDKAHAQNAERKDSSKLPEAQERRERLIPERQREIGRIGRRTYNLSQSERETLADIGRFRVIRLDDLALYRYSGRAPELTRDLRKINRQALVEKKTVWTGRNREQVTFVALTKAGKAYLKRADDGIPQQAIYAGFVKPAELRHDAAIYPMFHKEAARIASEGGRVGRVILDYELKKKAYSPLAKAKALPPDQYAKRQAEIAQANGLKVVNGHIALPDLRIEYITREGTAASVDLELATESYHGSHAAEKAGAGFKIYAASQTAARLSAALEEREITAEILSL